MPAVATKPRPQKRQPAHRPKAALHSHTETHGPGEYATLLERLMDLGKLDPDWNGDGAAPPNPKSRAAAQRLLAAVWHARRMPDHVKPSAQGGIYFAFENPERTRYVTLSCRNAGSVVATFFDRKKNDGEAEEYGSGDDAVRDDRLVARINRFLG